MIFDKRINLYLPENVQPQASGYSEAGASRTKRVFRGFQDRSISPREDIDWNNDTLRQRSRMLFMSAPLANSAINTSRTKVVGRGLVLKSAIDCETLGISEEKAAQWQRHTEREFQLWADRKESCDATGVNNFAGLQQLALISWLMSGDVFVLFQRKQPSRLRPYSLCLHLIEADRVRTPSEYGGLSYPHIAIGKNTENNNRIFDGVEVDSQGMVVAYFVHNSYPWQFVDEENKWNRIKAYGDKTGLPNILQIMSSERPDQYRGVPFLAPVMEPLLQLRRYTESSIMMAVVQSYFTAWIITENPSEIPFNETGGGIVGFPNTNPVEDIPPASTRSPNELGMAPGTVNVLNPNEKVAFGNPTMPVTGFDSFIHTFTGLIGAGLGIPQEVLTKEFQSSYSAARAALLESYAEFSMRRQWVVDDLCQPTYEAWLAEAVARGRVPAPGFFDNPLIRAAWCRAQWIGPSQGSIDPLKEVTAAILQIQHGLKTHEQVTREVSGGDWAANVARLKAENSLLADADGMVSVNVNVDTKEEDEEKEMSNIERLE